MHQLSSNDLPLNDERHKNSEDERLSDPHLSLHHDALAVIV